MRNSLKTALASLLIIALLVTGVPVFPGSGEWFTREAHASTNMRIEPSELEADTEGTVRIIFSFNAADDGLAEHEIKINMCTPQADGSSPQLGGLIASGTYETLDSAGNYIVHEVEWDGKVDGVKLPEGRYTVCVSPAEYNGIGVYYGQMASFEIVGSTQPKPPASLEAAPGASGKTLVSGTAATGTTVELEISYSDGSETQEVTGIAVNSDGQWSKEVALTTGAVAQIAARASKDGATSGYSELLEALRYPLPSFPISWEAVAGYFYKTDSVEETAETAQSIAEVNKVSGSVCGSDGTGCSAQVSGVTSLLLLNPETARSPQESELEQYTAAAIENRLRIVNPSGEAPIDSARGDFVYYAPSLSLQAIMPLDFGLTYLSRDSYEGAAGLGWHHSYEWSLTPVDDKLELMQPNGARFEFIPLADGLYQSPRGTDLTLSKTSGGYALETPGGVTYSFDSEGQLESIADLNSNTVELSYSGGKLNKVSTLGASLSLTYNGQGLLSGISDYTGREMAYGYSAAGDLTSVTDVDGGVTAFGYDDAHHVISVTNPANTGTVNVTYDEEQRVIGYTDEYGASVSSNYQGKVAPVERGEDAGSSDTGIHPGSGYDIPESDEVLLSGTMYNLANAPAYRTVAGLQPVIGDYIDSQVSAIQSSINSYGSSAIDCSSCDMAGIQSAIAGAGSGLVVVKAGQLNVEQSVTLGSASKPVVLIAEGMNTNQDITVTVYGTLVIKQALNANTKLKLYARSVSGSYGNIWVNGAVHLNNDSTVETGDTLYAGSLTYNSGLLTIDAQRVLVSGELHINTQVQMDIAEEISLGGLVSNNDVANVTITGGDLFIRDNVAVNNQLAIRTGGVFAVGGDMTPNKKPDVLTGIGSGKTILTYTEGDGGSSIASFRVADVASVLADASVTTYTDALGRSTSYTWNDRFWLKSALLADGTSREYGYDGGGRVVSTKDGNGNLTSAAYDERGNLLQTVNGSGESTNYRYNALNRLTAVTGALGFTETYAYDAKGNQTAATNALGETSTTAYDSHGVPVKTTNAKGESTIFTNDAYGFTKQIEDASGYVKEIARDELHRVTQLSDAEGVIQQLNYDAKGRTVETINALGETSATEYDLLGNVASQTDAAGGRITYAYEVERLVNATDAMDYTRSMEYDAVGNVTAETDANGGTSGYAYDELNRVKETTDAEGNRTSMTYDGNGNVLTETDGEGNTTRYTYNSNNQLVSVTDPEGGVTSYKYDAEGQMIKETNALGNSTWYEYDALGRLARTTDALKNVTAYAYDEAGNLVSTTDPNGAVWQTKYDERGLSTGSIDPLLNETFTEYDERGLMSVYKDAEGGVTRYEYDAAGRNTRMIDPLEQETSYAYDELGNVTQVTDALGRSTLFDYDALGRLSAVTDASGHTTSYAYDANGNLTEQTDANGNTKTYRYNALGQLEEQSNALDEATEYAYDANGNVTLAVAPDGTETEYHYDANGRLVKTVYGDGQSVSYEYDLIGRRVEMNDANGQTRYTYDALNRLTELIDYRGENVRYEWNNAGQRTRVIYPDNTSVRYAYDALSRVSQVTDTNGGITSYSYDANSRLTGKTLPNGGTTAYRYNAAGALLEMTHKAAGGTVLEQLAYQYDAVGNIVHSERQEGGSDEDHPSGGAAADEKDFAYDALNQLIEVQKRNGSSTLYSYDAVGNRLTKSVEEDGDVTTENYTYDAANKLTYWENGDDYKEYSYDGRGNLQEVSGNASTALLMQLQADLTLEDLQTEDAVSEDVYGADEEDAVYTDEEDEDSVTNSTYGDPDDWTDEQLMALLAGTGAFALEQYEWDAANRLIEQTNENGDVTSYGYDGDGNRVYMGTALGSTAVQDGYPISNPAGMRDGWEPQYKKEITEFYFTNDVTLALPEPLTASDEDGSWAQSYVYGAGNERISMTYAVSGDPSNAWEPVTGASGAGATGETNTLYYLSDMLGSVIGLEGADGTISARYHYDEFGVALDAEKLDVNWAGPDNLFGYTGLNYDSSSGLSYARARYFDSSIGRFISEDTYTGDINSPQTLNLYAYVSNNPLVYTDPSGNKECKGAYRCDGDIVTGTNNNKALIHHQEFDLVDAGLRVLSLDGAMKNSIKIHQSLQVKLLIDFANDLKVKQNGHKIIIENSGGELQLDFSHGSTKATKGSTVVYNQTFSKVVDLNNVSLELKNKLNVYPRPEGDTNVFDQEASFTLNFSSILGNSIKNWGLSIKVQYTLLSEVAVNKRDVKTIEALSLFATGGAASTIVKKILKEIGPALAYLT